MEARAEDLDVAIVGGGAAGLNAALVLARARRRIAVFDDGNPRNAVLPHTYGFLGHDGIAPSELLRLGRAEVAGYGAALVDRRVDAVDAVTDHFTIRAGERTWTARAVILATGLVDELPPIEGLAEIWGTDAAGCPYCHGWEVRDQRLALVGLAEKLPRVGARLSIWSRDVTIYSGAAESFDAPSRARLAAAGVDVVASDPVRVVRADGRLRGIELADGTLAACDAIFVASPSRAASTLAVGLCDVDTAGFALIDADGRTSRSGVWAVGNAGDPLAKLIHAAAAGSKAAAAVNEYLLEADLRTRPALTLP